MCCHVIDLTLAIVVLSPFPKRAWSGFILSDGLTNCQTGTLAGSGSCWSPHVPGCRTQVVPLCCRYSRRAEFYACFGKTPRGAACLEPTDQTARRLSWDTSFRAGPSWGAANA